jgi:hypothetical protein
VEAVAGESAAPLSYGDATMEGRGLLDLCSLAIPMLVRDLH